MNSQTTDLVLPALDQAGEMVAIEKAWSDIPRPVATSAISTVDLVESGDLHPLASFSIMIPVGGMSIMVSIATIAGLIQVSDTVEPFLVMSPILSMAASLAAELVSSHFWGKYIGALLVTRVIRRKKYNRLRAQDKLASMELGVSNAKQEKAIAKAERKVKKQAESIASVINASRNANMAFVNGQFVSQNTLFSLPARQLALAAQISRESMN